MRKIFTLFAAVFASFSLWAADPVFKALGEATLDQTGQNPVYTWSFSELKCKNVPNVYVEVPANASGTIAWACTSSNTGRFLYLYTMENDVLTKQTDRKIAMNTAFDKTGVQIAFTSADIVVHNDTGYLVFGTTDDFKAKGIQLVVTNATPPTPSTDSVATAEVSGANECYVGKSVTLTCTAANATTYQWYNTDGAIDGATAKTYVFTPAAEGSYGFYCMASNQYNNAPVRSNSFVVTATVKPAAVSCANIIPASSGTAPTEVGTEIDLDAASEGGKIFVAGMKTPGESIVYNALGLGLMKGGADSIRVEFNNLIAEGSVIQFVMAAGGESERGLKLQTPAKSTLLDAKWTPAAIGEVKEFEYTVPAGSKLIGDYRILLQRNNSVYLQSVSMADCGAAREIPVDTVPALKASPDSINLAITAAQAADSAVVTFSGKNLTAGNYALTIPDLAGLIITPTSVTVDANGKLSAAIMVKYATEATVAAASTSFSLTIGELTRTVKVGYSAVHTKQYVSSINIEQLVLDNSKKYNIKSALAAANVDYSNIDALDSLDSSKAYNNYPYLGLKLKKTDASLGFWLRQGSKVNMKFGNIGANFNVHFGDSAQLVTANSANMQATDSNVVSCGPVAEDTYVSIVCGSTSTLVIKQIMIDTDIQPVVVEPGVDPTKDSDATIKSLTINGDTITPQSTTFAYEVPAALDLAEVEVVYELNSAKATSAPASGFKVAVPAAGAAANEQTLTVTAESGAKVVYTISVTRAEAPSQDPVTAAAIQGAANAYVGDEVTLTCAAENATTFQWYKAANAISGATQATYKFTPDTAGEYTFACEASNEFTATPVRSADFKVTVTVRPPQPQVLVMWDAEAANRIGVISYGPSGVEEGEVKIHNNEDKVKGIKLGSSYSYADGKYVTFKPANGGFEEGDTIFVAVCYNNSSEKNAAVALYGADGADLLFTSQNGINGKTSADDPAVEAYILQDDVDSLFIGRSGNTSTFMTVLKVVRPVEVVGDPVLKVSANSATVKATAAEPTATAKVVFSGKHLTPGTYNFALTQVEGLSVSPASVTVPENGKFSQEVTITFAATKDVSMSMAELSLTINDIKQSVLISYSASMTKNYGKSIDFEQFVVENGVSGDFATALAAGNYIASLSGFSLDSLNSAKEGNNEPYLGLKIKAANAYVGCWLQKGDTISIKFGKVSANVEFTAGEQSMTKTPDDLVNPFEFIAADADTYVKLQTTSGEAVVIKHILIAGEKHEDQAITNVDAATKAVKVLRNGQLLIIRGDKTYTLTGMEL